MRRLVTTVIFGSALSSPAMAREVPERDSNRPVLLATLSSAATPASPRDLPDPVRAMLTAGDRGNSRSVRSRAFEGSFGPFDLAAFTSRIRSGQPGDSPMAFATERYRARAAGFSVSSGLFGGLGFRSEVLLTTMKRWAAVTPAGYRARSTAFAVVGAGLALDDGPALMLDYVRTTAPGRSAPAERMVEIAGGAPLAGRGLRLALTGGARGDETGRVGWSLSASSMRRPSSEMGFGPGLRSFSDNRGELAMQMAF